MTEERDFDIEDENPNPSEVDDDQLGETVLKPFDPKDVDEEDT